MWRIIFTYSDNSTLKISGKQREIPKGLAKKYLKEYAGTNNDGGIYRKSPYKGNPPIPLAELEN